MTATLPIGLSAGQSQAWGKGSQYGAPVPPAGKAWLYWNKSFPTPYVDPTPATPDKTKYQISDSYAFALSTGTWSSGLAWQTEHTRMTGETTLWVPAAMGSTSMAPGIPGCVDDWSPTGQCFSRAVQLFNEAIFRSQIDPIGGAWYTPGRKSIEWNQGNAEAGLLGGNGMAKETARDQMIDIAERFHVQFPDADFNIYAGGSAIDAATGNPILESGFAELLWAHEQAAAALPYARVVYRNAKTFVDRGMIQADNHWDQFGLNEAGTIGARNGFILR